MAGKRKKTGIVAFVPDLWDTIWQSRHHVLSGLAVHFKVLWVSPPTYWHSWLSGKIRASLVGRGLCKPSDNFWAYAPMGPADYKPHHKKQGFISSCFRRYNALWERRFVSSVRRTLQEMGLTRVILYLWRPEYNRYIGQFGEVLFCYHIDDDYGFDPRQDTPIGEDELSLLQRADLVFIHSRSLLRKKGHVNRNTYYLPNGVDFARYRQAMESDVHEPEDLARIPPPRIGYVGYIKRHINLALLLAIARARRDWSLVLIGPVRTEHSEISENVSQLRLEPNVYFLGDKSRFELPSYVKSLDVCLMCYLQTQYTKYIYPLKLHEYLACGKPVVATPLENLKEFSDVLRFAATPDQWVYAIQASLDDHSEELRLKRIATARENSWDVRVRSIVSLLQERLES